MKPRHLSSMGRQCDPYCAGTVTLLNASIFCAWSPCTVGDEHDESSDTFRALRSSSESPDLLRDYSCLVTRECRERLGGAVCVFQTIEYGGPSNMRNITAHKRGLGRLALPLFLSFFMLPLCIYCNETFKFMDHEP